MSDPIQPRPTCPSAVDDGRLRRPDADAATGAPRSPACVARTIAAFAGCRDGSPAGSAPSASRSCVAGCAAGARS